MCYLCDPNNKDHWMTNGLNETLKDEYNEGFMIDEELSCIECTWDDGDQGLTLNINYCPVCGRKLKE